MEYQSRLPQVALSAPSLEKQKSQQLLAVKTAGTAGFKLFLSYSPLSEEPLSRCKDFQLVGGLTEGGSSLSYYCLD